MSIYFLHACILKALVKLTVSLRENPKLSAKVAEEYKDVRRKQIRHA